MVKFLARLLSNVTAPFRRLFLAVALVVVTMAAAVWRHRADLVEAVGAVCVVVFAAGLGHGAGWLVAGVALVVKAAELDRRSRL